MHFTCLYILYAYTYTTYTYTDTVKYFIIYNTCVYSMIHWHNTYIYTLSAMDDILAGKSDKKSIETDKQVS